MATPELLKYSTTFSDQYFDVSMGGRPSLGLARLAKALSVDKVGFVAKGKKFCRAGGRQKPTPYLVSFGCISQLLK